MKVHAQIREGSISSFGNLEPLKKVFSKKSWIGEITCVQDDLETQRIFRATAMVQKEVTSSCIWRQHLSKDLGGIQEEDSQWNFSGMRTKKMEECNVTLNSLFWKTGVSHGNQQCSSSSFRENIINYSLKMPGRY